jgi:hypothetical protein
MYKMDDEEYKSLFIKIKKTGSTNEPETIYKRAYKIANDNRKFEIDNYWKRANYYWLFQFSVYTGYFYSVTTKNNQYLSENPEIIVGITCLGFLTALAWHFSNKGSKQWQENWENHVDYLEDGITGPLYKVFSSKETWSVSKINEIVSFFSAIAWILLGVKTIYSFFSCPLLIAYLAAMCIIVGSFYFSGKGNKQRGKKVHWFKIGEYKNVQ